MLLTSEHTETFIALSVELLTLNVTVNQHCVLNIMNMPIEIKY